MPSGSSGSSSKTWRPVRWALPSTSVTTAERPATSASPTTRPWNSEPTMLRCRSGSPRGSPPDASSSASRAEVPLPHGERSTSPSAKTVTLRCVRLTALVLPEDHAVDVPELGLERVDDLVRRLELGLDLAAELDQARQLARLDALLGATRRTRRRRRRRPPAGGREPGRPDERRHVPKADRADAAALDARDRLEPARGTSTTTRVSGSSTATSPSSIAQVTSAIVPCPQAVE